MFDFEKSANSIGKTQDQIHVENVSGNSERKPGVMFWKSKSG